MINSYLYNLNKIIKSIKLIPIYLFQKPAGYDFHLYGLMPVIGLITFTIHKKIEKEFIPFIILFSSSMIFAIYNSDWLSARRSLQTLCMIGFCSYLIIYFSDSEFKKLAKNIFYCIAFYYCYDFLYGEKIHINNLRLIDTYFFPSGILNNMNYTGFLSAGLALFFAINKENQFFILACCLVFISQSKTAFFLVLLSSPIFFISSCRDSKLKIYSYFIYVIILCYPLILFLIEALSSDQVKLIINLWSGSRYSIHLSYLELFYSFPFGVGYDRSHELIGVYLNQGSSIIQKGLFKPYFSDIGAHNSYLKILTEQGILGYFLYFIFIFLVLHKSLRTNRYLSVVYMAVCAAQLWLEGLNEFIVYFWTAVIFRLALNPDKSLTYGSKS